MRGAVLIVRIKQRKVNYLNMMYNIFMSKKKIYNNMKCPECGGKIDFWQQVRQWEEFEADDIEIDEDFGAYLAIFCPKCEDQVIGIDIYATPEPVEFDIPAIDNLEATTVRIKKPKSNTTVH